MAVGGRVTIAYSTMGPRLRGLRVPAPCAGFEYLVLVQSFDGRCPPALRRRGDVRVVPLHTLGLSHSRNAALEHACGDYLVFADDDMVLDLEGMRALAQQLEADPSLSFVAGWRAEYVKARGHPRAEAPLGRFNSGRICAPELMVRVSDVRRAGILFDPQFGVGAQYPLGEEYIFISDMLAAKFKGNAVSCVVGSHPTSSTGQIWDDPVLMQARSAMLHRVFGRFDFVMRSVYIWRHRAKVPRRADRVRFALGWGGDKGHLSLIDP